MRVGWSLSVYLGLGGMLCFFLCTSPFCFFYLWSFSRLFLSLLSLHSHWEIYEKIPGSNNFVYLKCPTSTGWTYFGQANLLWCDPSIFWFMHLNKPDTLPLWIASHNVQGLNSLVKCCKLFQLYHSQKLDVTLLQETHFSKQYNKKVKIEAPFKCRLCYIYWNKGLKKNTHIEVSYSKHVGIVLQRWFSVHTASGSVPFVSPVGAVHRLCVLINPGRRVGTHMDRSGLWRQQKWRNRFLSMRTVNGGDRHDPFSSSELGVLSQNPQCIMQTFPALQGRQT